MRRRWGSWSGRDVSIPANQKTHSRRNLTTGTRPHGNTRKFRDADVGYTRGDNKLPSCQLLLNTLLFSITDSCSSSSSEHKTLSFGGAFLSKQKQILEFAKTLPVSSLSFPHFRLSLLDHNTTDGARGRSRNRSRFFPRKTLSELRTGAKSARRTNFCVTTPWAKNTRLDADCGFAAAVHFRRISLPGSRFLPFEAQEQRSGAKTCDEFYRGKFDRK